MSLATLAEVKIACDISAANTSEDIRLTQFLRGCSGAIRRYVKSYMGGVITSNSLANPTVANAPGHGLQTGDTINFDGSNSTPPLAGLLVATRIDPDTFSLPVNVTVAGTLGYWSKQYTEFYSGTGSNTFVLKQTPVQSIVNLWFDSTGYFGTNPNGAFDPVSSLFVEGTDFVLKRDNANQAEVCLSGKVLRINSFWPRPGSRTLGLLASTAGDAMGNIKVIYTAGWMPISDDIRMACCEYVKLMRRGPGLMAEHYDYYGYNLDPAKDRDNVLGGVRQMLSGIKKWVW